MFQRLRENNLKLAPKKCYFLQKQVRFLGHVISGQGVSVDPSKVEVITKMVVQDLMESDRRTPSVRRIKSFLGMVFYYQHFIRNCSAIAKPLFALTAGQKRRGKSMKDKKFQGAFRKLTPADWTVECQDTFSSLNPSCCSVFYSPIQISMSHLFYQSMRHWMEVSPGESMARPVAFASKTLSVWQRRYPAHMFMALKWSVCEKFSHWLKGRSFTIWTDNNPVTYLLTKLKLDACEVCWVSKLASYFDLKHQPGKKNVVADAMSRDPFAIAVGQRLLNEPYSTLVQEANGVEEDCVQDLFRASCLSQACGLRSSPSPESKCNAADPAEALCQAHCDWIDGAETRALCLVQNTQQALPGLDSLTTFSAQELQLCQEQDPCISKVMPFIATKRHPLRHDRHGANSKVLGLFRQWDRLMVRNGVLYRVMKDPVLKLKRFQYVSPESLKSSALSGIHDLAGHQGQDRTLSLARQ